MTSLLFLASYPRSGNTFVRALLSNYVSGEPAPVDLNDLRRFTRGEHDEAIWRSLTGVALEARSLEQQWRARGAYFERLRAKADDSLLVKTHTPNGLVFGAPAFDIRPADRAIYIVRHPCDVAISRADFCGVPLETAVDQLLTDGFYVRGSPPHGFEVTGSWRQNVTSWQGETRCPVLCVRYPDLCRNPLFELTRMAGFLGLGVDPARVAQAVIFSRFEELQAQEAAHGFSEVSPIAASRRFFRAGRSGQWPEVMPPALARRMYDVCGPMIEQMGLDEAVPVEAPRRLQSVG